MLFVIHCSWHRFELTTAAVSCQGPQACREWVCDKIRFGVECHKNIPALSFLLFFFPDLFFINTLSLPQHLVYISFFLREWSQPATTRSWILKSRRLLGSVSAKRKRSGEWLFPSLSRVKPTGPTRCPLIFHALSHLPRLSSMALTVGLTAAMQSPTISAGSLSFLLHNEFVYRVENNP